MSGQKQVACALGGGRSGGPGEKGTGGVREAGVEGARSERNRGKLRNIAKYFAIEKMRNEAGADKNKGGNRD